MVYDEIYLCVWELAGKLNISARTVPSLVKRGIVPPPVKIGRLRRYFWPAVCEALNGKRDALIGAMQ